jgi:hypothetical protein
MIVIQEDTLWYLYVFKTYLSWIYPLNHSPSSSLSPLLRIISQGLIHLFSYMHTKHIYYIHPHSPFPCANPHSSGIQPQKRFIFLSWPSFFNYMQIDSPAGFCLGTSGLYISCLLESFFYLCHIHTIAFHCLSLHMSLTLTSLQVLVILYIPIIDF